MIVYLVYLVINYGLNGLSRYVENVVLAVGCYMAGKAASGH